MAELCEAYWYPLYAYVRRQGHAPEEARDLTQAFFAYLLEKEVLKGVDPSAGRFRTYLLNSLQYFLSHERDKAQALKRGGDTRTLSLDTEAAETRYGFEATDELTPEQIFEHRWAMTVLERTMERLRTESGEGEGRRTFERLKDYLTGQEPHIPYREMAAELEMTDGAVRGAVHRLRRRFGRLLLNEIAETVSDPADVEDEARHMLQVITPWEAQQG
jgi:RNA polymerase sigma-70 factor (ECF subfamily)